MSIRNPRLLKRGPPFKRKKARGLFAQGLSYEKKALALLEKACPNHLWKGQWFSYEDAKGKRRYCQTDGLTLYNGTIYVFEVKRTALLSAYDKLNDLYYPVVKGAFNDVIPVKRVQIFKYLTKATLLAHPIIPLAKLFEEEADVFGIHLLT